MKQCVKENKGLRGKVLILSKVQPYGNCKIFPAHSIGSDAMHCVLVHAHACM